MQKYNIIDTHHHLWDLSNGYYSWLTPSLKPIYKNYNLLDYEQKANDIGIEKSIVVQAADNIAESFYLLQLASKSNIIQGVIGWIDMLSTNALQDISKLGQNHKFKGIRPMLQDLDQLDWILNPLFDPIFKYLSQQQLIFEALIRPFHIPHIITIAKKYPNLQIVINHGAKPIINNDSETTNYWRMNMRELSSYGNVYCKLSGLVTEVQGEINLTTLQPFMEHIINIFGSHRVMFGSDYPVINLACSYEQWLSITDSFLQSFSNDEKKNILQQNAKRLYKI